jgi:hypothetical protein
LAQVDAAVLAGMLVWGLDQRVWLAIMLAGAACVGLAAALTVLHSFSLAALRRLIAGRGRQRSSATQR